MGAAFGGCGKPTALRSRTGTALKWHLRAFAVASCIQCQPADGPVTTPTPHELAQRVEEASLNAWPALHQVLLDGWVLRFSRGFTKRANSITPLYPSRQSTFAKVRYCEDLYAGDRLPAIFRLTTIEAAEPLDRLLADRGYRKIDPTEVLHVPLEERKSGETRGFVEASLASFLVAYAGLTEVPGVDASAAGRAMVVHATVLRAIRAETVFGLLVDEGEPVACAMAVVERELAGLFDVVVHPESRRRGHGRALVEGLLDRASEMGARRAYLQVLKDNASARSLYAKLGFEPLYEYWYRVPKQ